MKRRSRGEPLSPVGGEGPSFAIRGTEFGTRFSTPSTQISPLHTPSAASKPQVHNHDPG